MKNLFYFVLMFCSCVTLSSCYALIKAERFVYTGSVAKQPNAVSVDSSFVVTSKPLQ